MLMNDSDYIAQLFTLFCVASSFIVLSNQERTPFPMFSIFSLLLVPASFIWLFSLWEFWAWFFPVVMLSLAAAAGEAAWGMTEKLHKRERIYSHIFSIMSGGALAGLTLAMRPFFPRFPDLSMIIGMCSAAFAVGCTLSAAMYWWANRSAGVRPLVRHGSFLGVYGVVVIASAVVSGLDPQGPLWHWSVDVSCYLRGILQVCATWTLVRAQRFFAAAA